MNLMVPVWFVVSVVQLKVPVLFLLPSLYVGAVIVGIVGFDPAHSLVGLTPGVLLVVGQLSAAQLPQIGPCSLHGGLSAKLLPGDSIKTKVMAKIQPEVFKHRRIGIFLRLLFERRDVAPHKLSLFARPLRPQSVVFIEWFLVRIWVELSERRLVAIQESTLEAVVTVRALDLLHHPPGCRLVAGLPRNSYAPPCRRDHQPVVGGVALESSGQHFIQFVACLRQFVLADQSRSVIQPGHDPLLSP